MKENILLRSAKPEDAEAVLEIYRPYILNTPVSFETEVPSLEDYRNRIIQYQETLPWLVCEIDKSLAGYSYAIDHRKRKAYDCSKELSVYVHEHYRNRGIASGLYTAVIELLKHQGVSNVLAGIALPNPESVGFHEKFGFQLVGIYHNVGYKLGKYHNAGWWELPIGNGQPPPDRITPVSDLYDTAIWHEAMKSGISKIHS